MCVIASHGTNRFPSVTQEPELPSCASSIFTKHLAILVVIKIEEEKKIRWGRGNQIGRMLLGELGSVAHFFYSHLICQRYVSMSSNKEVGCCRLAPLGLIKSVCFQAAQSKVDGFEGFGINSQLAPTSNFLFLWNLGMCGINVGCLLK